MKLFILVVLQENETMRLVVRGHCCVVRLFEVRFSTIISFQNRVKVILLAVQFHFHLMLLLNESVTELYEVSNYEVPSINWHKVTTNF